MSDVQTIWARTITPLLHVGPGEMKMPHTIVDTARAAYVLMLESLVAVVPSDDVAREVLRLFGADDAHIELRIRQSYPTI